MDQPPDYSQQASYDSFDEEVTFVSVGASGDEAQSDVSIVTSAVGRDAAVEGEKIQKDFQDERDAVMKIQKDLQDEGIQEEREMEDGDESPGKAAVAMANMEQSPHYNQQGLEDSFDEEVSLVSIGASADEAQSDVSIVSPAAGGDATAVSEKILKKREYEGVQDIEDSFDEEETLVPFGASDGEARFDISTVCMELTNIVDGLEIDDDDSFGERGEEQDSEMTMTTDALSSEEARASSFSEDPDYETKASMVRIFQTLVHHTKFCLSDIDKVVKYFTESSEEVSMTLKEILEVGMMKLFHDANVSPQAVSAVCRFTSVVAMRAYQEVECVVPLNAVQEVVDTFMKRSEAHCRVRSCELLARMLTTATESSEFMDGDVENKLPSAQALQWCVLLCNRRIDKEDVVRCAALKAISRLHLERFFDHNGQKATPFGLICSSLNDVSPEVRKTAIQLLPLSSREAVDMAIRFLGYQDEMPALRIQMAERIIRDVHLKSFTDRQKIAFLTQLYNDKDEDVKSLLGTKVVGTWLRQLAHDQSDPMEEEENRVLPAHPSALLKYLNFIKNEEIVLVTIKLALSYYMNVAVGSRTDAISYLDFLRKMPVSLRESSGVLHRKTVLQEIQADRSELPQRLFMHRCLVEFLCGLCADSPANTDIIVSRLLPNALDLSTLFQNYATRIFSSVPSVNQLFVFRQILHLIHLTDLDCSVGKKAFDDALKILISGETVRAPLDVVENAVDEVWNHVVKADQFDRDEFIDWAGFAVGRLLDAVPSLETQIDMRSYSEEEANTVLHAATILQGVLQNPTLHTLSPLIRSAFERIAVPLKFAVTSEGRQLMARLIGLAALLDTTGSIVRMHAITFRHSLIQDHMDVKVVTLQALTDVCWKYGWGLTAQHCFPEISDKLQRRDALATICEQVVICASGSNFLPRAIFHACRLLTRFTWPKLIGAILYRLFEGTADAESDHLARVFFPAFTERGEGARIELITGFFACCCFVEEKGLRRFRFGALMSFVCDLLNRKLKNESSKKLPNGSTSDTVFAVNLLKKIGSDPSGTVQPHLACVCLAAINVTKIVSGDAHEVLKTAASVQNRLASDPALAKMKAAVGKFVKTLEKQTEKGNQTPRKTPRRYVPVKLEEPDSDLEDTDSEELQYRVPLKRRRLSRVSGCDSPWSRRTEETVKQDVLTQRVKEEILDEYWQDPEAIVIDSEDDEISVLSVKTPRSRCRRTKKRRPNNA